MNKRTNRVAWGLVAVLAVALVAGTGGMLTHGVRLGSWSATLRWSGQWAVGPGQGFGNLGVLSEPFHLGFITLHILRPAPWCAKEKQLD